MVKQIYKDLNMIITHMLTMNLQNNVEVENITSNSYNLLIQNKNELKVYNVENEMISHTLSKNNLPVCLESEFFLKFEGKKLLKTKFVEDEVEEEKEEKKEEEKREIFGGEDVIEPEIFEVTFEHDILDIKNDADRFYVLTNNSTIEVLDYQLHVLGQIKFPVQLKKINMGNEIFYHRHNDNSIEAYNDDGISIKKFDSNITHFLPYANLLLVYAGNKLSLLDSVRDYIEVESIILEDVQEFGLYECYLFYINSKNVVKSLNIADNLNILNFEIKINGKFMMNKAHVIDYQVGKLDIYSINLKVQENIREYFENEEIRNLILTLKNKVKNLYLDYNYEKTNQTSIKNQIYDLKLLLRNFYKNHEENQVLIKKKIDDKKNNL